MRVEFPAKLAPLFKPSRFKDIRGGRDSGKSWGAAMALIELGAAKKLLVVCARETRESVQDSIHRNLSEKIEMLGMQNQYLIEKQRITHRHTGTEFIFRGLLNPDAIKSLEGCDIAWIEEAQTMSEESWRKVIPTVRRDDSEIWLTWNPELDTDPTWKHCVVNPEPGMTHIVINYTDNPWASKVLNPQREKMQRDDPDEFAHVYMGQPKRQIQGAVYANEIRLAEEQGRICKVEHHPGAVVRCGWDLGDSDIMAVWFFQSIMGQHRFLRYYENRHQPLDHYLEVCADYASQFGWRYGEDYFPWDASSKVLAGALETTMRLKGRTVKILPRMGRDAGIDKSREMLGTSYFDIDGCADGLNRMRYYRYGQTSTVDPRTGDRSLTREPVHDDNSHGADAYRTCAMGYRTPKEPVKPIPPGSRPMMVPPPRRGGGYAPMG